jgi:hypothetical protein
MKTIKNAPFYLIIVAIVKEQIINCGTILKVGEEWIVDQSQMRTTGYDRSDEFYVMKRSPISFMGYNVFKVPVKSFELQVKTIVPKYKVGDVVIRKDAVQQTIASRVSSYNLSHGSIWYQDEWGDSQGLASGHLEEDIRLATPEEIERCKWALERKYSKA